MYKYLHTLDMLEMKRNAEKGYLYISIDKLNAIYISLMIQCYMIN